MCRRLGKKHHQYVGGEGLRRQRYEKSIWSGRPLASTYTVRILNDHCYLRDVFWNPQHDVVDSQGVFKRLTPRKQKLYIKLERYYDRSFNGK